MHRTIFVLIFLLSSVFLSFAQAEDASAALQELVDQLDTYSADFTQTTYEQDGYLLDEQSGEIFFSPPGRLRWEAKEPYLQTLVADGEYIHLYDPDLNQVTVRPWSDDAAQNPAAVFVSRQNLSSHFLIEEDGSAPSGRLFNLTPLSISSSITGLSIRFEDSTPIAMEILDTLGQRTSIEFVNAEVGNELDQALFIFRIPEGAEVITDG